jgi:hypothetical protein
VVRCEFWKDHSGGNEKGTRRSMSLCIVIELIPNYFTQGKVYNSAYGHCKGEIMAHDLSVSFETSFRHLQQVPEKMFFFCFFPPRIFCSSQKIFFLCKQRMIKYSLNVYSWKWRGNY